MNTDQDNGCSRPAAIASQPDPDEINILEYLYALLHRKWIILAMTALGLASGMIIALVKGPDWIAEAVIAPKESDSQKTPSLAGLGALGGLVASQLNMAGNANLEKIDIILDSRNFNAKMVEKYGYLPVIYKYQWPGKYRKFWDLSRQQWKPGFIAPEQLDMGRIIKGKFLKKTTNKNNTMMIKIQSHDSTLSFNLASM
jgi:hypothetical protein